MKAVFVNLLGILLFIVSNFAFAEAKGVFLLSGGEADVEKEKDAFSGSDTAFKIGSGFRVTESSAIEIYYANYGASEDTVNFPGLGNKNVEVEVYSLAFQYVHFLPVANSVDILARLGVAFWKSEFDIHQTGLFNDSGIGAVGGLGTEIDVLDNLAVRVEWEYSLLHNFEVNYLSFGISHYFD